jgi:hypothetical protein
MSACSHSHGPAIGAVWGRRSTWKAVAHADGVAIKSHESLVRRVGGIIYVPVIARCIVRCRVLGQGVTPTI